MPDVLDAHGVVVFRGQSDAECVRWWIDEGAPDDRLADTDETMEELAHALGLD